MSAQELYHALQKFLLEEKMVVEALEKNHGHNDYNLGRWASLMDLESFLNKLDPEIFPDLGADTEAAAEPVGGGGVMDVIDREQAMDALDALCDRVCEYSKKQRAVMCRACTLGSAFDVLEELPSARPKGKWIDITKCGGASLWKCSECGELFLEDFYFCPNCGADMMGE